MREAGLDKVLKEELVTCGELLGFEKSVDTSVVNIEEGSIVSSEEVVDNAVAEHEIYDLVNTQIEMNHRKHMRRRITYLDFDFFHMQLRI